MSKKSGQVSALECLQPGDRPLTPAEVKKFRTQGEPGQKVLHHGIIGLEVPSHSFGKKTERNETAGEVINPQRSRLEQQALDLKEQSVYNRPALGKSSLKKNSIPPEAQNSVFGKGTQSSEGIEKLLNPDDSIVAEDEETKRIYMKSHGVTDPGKPKTRNYDWERSGIDPEEYTFGKVQTRDSLSAYQAMLQPNTEASDYPRRPKGAKDRVEELTRDPAFTFGSKTHVWDSAKEVLRGHPEDENDPSIGKNVKPGTRNSYDGRRENGTAFGVPSIRSDSKPKNIKFSRQGERDYGEDSGLGASNSTRGIYNQDWLQSRSKGELRDIINSAGVQASHEQFEEAYSMALKRGDVSLESFHKFLIEVKAKDLNL